MDSSRFPLMQLPLACSQSVLRNLTPIQLFGISLASKKSKGLVQSLKIKAPRFTVHITDVYSIWLRFRDGFLRFFDLQYSETRPGFSVEYKNIEYRWFSNEMDGRTFINHLKFIFNTEKVKVEFGINSEHFDIESFFKGRQDIESINLITDNQEENRRILNIIQPPMVSMNNIPPRDILIQNFQSLVVNNWNFNLNDLLLMNSRRFEASCRIIPAKQLNRFLKLWMRGSNPQLESLALCFRIGNDFMEAEVFNGLKATQNDQVRFFNSGEKIFKVDGGIDIFRFDGTMGTIRVKNYGRVICRLEMYVWYDHCIEESDL